MWGNKSYPLRSCIWFVSWNISTGSEKICSTQVSTKADNIRQRLNLWGGSKGTRAAHQFQHNLGESLCTLGVQWKFIPKRAPWYGGFWEKLISFTKTTLWKVLGRSSVTLQELQTLVVEIEAVLNDRPLTYVSPDVDDLEPLTPSHLLCGRRITSLPHKIFDDDPTYNVLPVREIARRQSELLQHFEKRWKREYLMSLLEYHKTTGNIQQSIKVGDVVTVHDDIPRVHWKLAEVEKLITGLDGYTRAAEIRTATGKTNCPIAKLFPLEVTEEISIPTV